MEIELKLSVAASDVITLCNLPLLQQSAPQPPTTEHLLSTYFDTPELTLKHHRSALRVRKTPHAWIQTFKGGGGAAAGLHQRHEWESEVAGPALELESLLPLIDQPAAKAILAQPGLVERLQPLFTTDFERTAWMLHLAQDTVVELALDQGKVSAGESTAPICEIELELKQGQLPVLLAFSQELRQLLPLQPSNISKAQRGFALRFPQQDSSL
ncbi:inorganic triphosphatase YgiF [Herbaspirillum sp. Sphag1AN]|uniref:CYTH domain-containing protein n=1 Tax=unclassified Herbaspirillum TaxID=2624150 RepID=UPI00162057E7|nr:MULTISPECIES: CYTH domain-containing protein [unclassified Herbaspirillum]MBB3213175.1 inorganic triphosphatase YgiF [Herbaspirillum sp. Sphag1AN]MBB3246372.1 inorganic triphosphatase YgiF [Herbaspirillum sp. Sphag64]